MLFKSTVPTSEMDYETEEGQMLLSRPSGFQRKPEKMACPACKKQTLTSLRGCGCCGVQIPIIPTRVRHSKQVPGKVALGDVAAAIAEIPPSSQSFSVQGPSGRATSCRKCINARGKKRKAKPSASAVAVKAAPPPPEQAQDSRNTAEGSSSLVREVIFQQDLH